MEGPCGSFSRPCRRTCQTVPFPASPRRRRRRNPPAPWAPLFAGKGRGAKPAEGFPFPGQVFEETAAPLSFYTWQGFEESGKLSKPRRVAAAKPRNRRSGFFRLFNRGGSLTRRSTPPISQQELKQG